MTTEKKACAKCGKQVMHYTDRNVEKHKTPGTNVYCTNKKF